MPTSAHLDQKRCEYLLKNEYHLCVSGYVEQKCVICFLYIYIYLAQWTQISDCEVLIIQKEDHLSVY